MVSQFKSIFVLGAITIFCGTTFAQTQILDASSRIETIKNGSVWQKPDWMDENFEFDSSFRPSIHPAIPAYLESLFSSEVSCVTTEELQEDSFGGRTPKFNCYLLKPGSRSADPSALVLKPTGEPTKLKVKYTFYKGGRMNEEVYGEYLATRLLRALGFYADRMFPVLRTTCYGCTQHPFENRKIDPTTLSEGRVFGPTVVEVKLDGVELKLEKTRTSSTGEEREPIYVEGFSFSELMKHLPDDPAARESEFVKREALRIFAIFINHLDLKKENQRIICDGPVDANGICSSAKLYLQDVGSTFGAHMKGLSWKKVDLEGWKRPFFKDPSTCKSDFNKILLPDSSMANSRIYESGRQFFLKLMDGFSAGPVGLERVRDLFEKSQITYRNRGETVDMWVDAFYKRLEQVRYPMGSSNPNFRCPQ